MTARPPLAEQYAAALDEYLAEPSEKGLTAAYELGRRALDEGTGVLALLAAHADALRSRLDMASAELTTSATAFLYECIAPLEMAFRGFADAHQALREVNAELQAVNATLEQTVERRTAELNRALHEVEEQASARLRYAREVNDAIVQVLVAAEVAADLGHADESRRMLGEACRSAREWIGEQLADTGPLRPGSLVRTQPAARRQTDEVPP